MVILMFYFVYSFFFYFLINILPGRSVHQQWGRDSWHDVWKRWNRERSRWRSEKCLDDGGTGGGGGWPIECATAGPQHTSLHPDYFSPFFLQSCAAIGKYSCRYLFNPNIEHYMVLYTHISVAERKVHPWTKVASVSWVSSIVSLAKITVFGHCLRSTDPHASLHWLHNLVVFYAVHLFPSFISMFWPPQKKKNGELKDHRFSDNKFLYQAYKHSLLERVDQGMLKCCMVV